MNKGDLETVIHVLAETVRSQEIRIASLIFTLNKVEKELKEIKENE